MNFDLKAVGTRVHKAEYLQPFTRLYQEIVTETPVHLQRTHR
jgi:hypothetical protein